MSWQARCAAAVALVMGFPASGQVAETAPDVDAYVLGFGLDLLGGYKVFGDLCYPGQDLELKSFLDNEIEIRRQRLISHHGYDREHLIARQSDHYARIAADFLGAPDARARDLCEGRLDSELARMYRDLHARPIEDLRKEAATQRAEREMAR